MITARNFNRFWGEGEKKDWDNLSDEKKKEHLISCFDYIKSHLNTDNDIFLVFEVPFKDLEKNNRYSDDKNANRKAFEKAFENDKIFEVKYAERQKEQSNGDCVFQTAAIFKKDAYKVVYNELLNKEFRSFRNRILALQRNIEEPTETIVALHAPLEELDCVPFWDSLIRFHRYLHSDIPIYYIGDMNAFLPNKLQKRKMHEFMAEGVEDYWLGTGKSNNSSTHIKGQRLDYVLVSNVRLEKLYQYKDFFNKSEMIYEPKDISDKTQKDGLSDHSAIMLGTPSELEPFKTKT